MSKVPNKIMIDWKNISLSKEKTLREAMELLDKWALRVVLVVDANEKLEGVITDGDVRRGLLKGLTMDAPVDIIMSRRPLVAFPEVNSEYIRKLMANKNILAIPIVDITNRVVGLETIDTVQNNKNNSCDVVLIAGGFGKRLHPLTEQCPKPLLKLGNKPILESIIQDFIEQGFPRFFISTHYKSNLIKEYFSDGSDLGCEILYINEEKPLGTAGCLGFLPDTISQDFIVMNADVITKINFQNLLNFHQEQARLATMCIREMVHKLPYGVVSVDYPHVSRLREKPEYTDFINAGIYALNKKVLERVGKGEHLDMTDLLEQLINKGRNVVAFPIHEYWMDIGRMEDYEKVMSGI